MASVVTLPGSPSSITFNGEEARDFLYEEAFNKPAITAFHSVTDNVMAKKQLAYMNRFGKLTIADPGCGTGISTETLSTSEKFWDPVETKIWIQQCQKDIKDSLFVWANGKGYNRKDLNTNEIWTGFILDFLADAKMEDILRMAWLSDTNYVAGDLTNGATDLKFYNLYDGFWRQALDSISNSTGAVRAGYTIAENGLSTTALQLDLNSTAAKQQTALKTFQSLMRDADTRLSASANKVIICTKTLADNYAEYLETQGNDVSFERIEGGYQTLNFRGIPVYSFDLLDRYIQADFLTGSPATYDTPHRAMLTTTDNLAVGFDGLAEDMQIKVFFDDTTELWNGKMLGVEDVKIIWDYNVAIAY